MLDEVIVSYHVSPQNTLGLQNQTVYLIKRYVSYFHVNVLINAASLSAAHTSVGTGTALFLFY